MAQVSPPEWNLQQMETKFISARKRADAYLEGIQNALNELGEPNADYPAPVANAVAILKEAKRA